MKSIDGEKLIENLRRYKHEVISVDGLEGLINLMPSVVPERAKGKWISEVKGKEVILDEFGNVTCSAHCSECGDWLTASDEYSCRGRYCPNCGADMRGEKDEQR